MSQTNPLSVPGVLQSLSLEAIALDEGSQARVQVRQAFVRAYAQAMKEQMKSGGLRFPPVVVYTDDTHYWLGDGFHRILAARAAGLTEFPAEVRPGSQRDALLWSISANAEHGLPRTNADKRRAVSLLLADPEWGQWNDNEIARRCQVSHVFVGRLRKNASCNGYKIGPRKVQRGDSVFEMRPGSDRRAAAGRSARVRKVQPAPEASDAVESQLTSPPGTPSKPPPAVLPDADLVGLPLTDRVREIFAGRALFVAAQELHEELGGLIDRLAQSPAGAALRQQLVRRVRDGKAGYAAPELNFLGQKLATAVPFCGTCPRCDKKHPGQVHSACKLCGGRGWLTKGEYDACPAHERQDLERLRTAHPLGQTG